MNFHSVKYINFIWWRLIYLLLIGFSIFFITILNEPVQSFSIRGLTEHSLRDLSYKGINFKCSNKINDNTAFLALENFLNNYNFYNIKGFAKYYINNNVILNLFDRLSCYSHPNFYIGAFNDVLFNYQFTHKKLNNNFLNLTEFDINGNEKIQYYCKNINLYHNSLPQIYLNKNHLYLNESFIDLNKELVYQNTIKNLKIQNYIDLNCKDLNNIIMRYLKIKK